MDLLTICGMPEWERPTRSIVIEDLDTLILQSITQRTMITNSNTSSTTDHTCNITSTMMKTGMFYLL